jgi:hypothetical protein
VGEGDVHDQPHARNYSAWHQLTLDAVQPGSHVTARDAGSGAVHLGAVNATGHVVVSKMAAGIIVAADRSTFAHVRRHAGQVFAARP